MLTLIACAWAAGACKGSSIPMAPTQSPHFEPVAANLQLGGTVYVYADVEGDASRAAEFFLSLLRQAGATDLGAPPLEATRLVQALGLSDVDAVGMSSYRRGDLYHNRSFVYRTGPRRGVLALFGGDPKPFEMTSLTTAGTDLLWEQQLDLSVLVDIARSFGALGVGPSPAELDRALAKNLPGLDVTVGSLVNRPTTTLGVIVDVDEERVLRIPGDSFWFPLVDVLVKMDGFSDIMAAIERRAYFDPFLRAERTDELLIIGTSIRLPPPWNAYQPVLIQELATDRVYFASSPQFFDRSRSATERVTATESYQTAFDALPDEGNGMVFLSRSLTREVHGLIDRFINESGASARTMIARLLLPDAGLPVGWVGANRSDGILFTSNSPSSHKSTLLTLGYAGLVPALLWIAGSNEPPPPPPSAEPFRLD